MDSHSFVRETAKFINASDGGMIDLFNHILGIKYIFHFGASQMAQW